MQGAGGARRPARPAGFLVVEDELACARSIARSILPYGGARHAASVAAARKLLAANVRWTGLIVDLGLPDGSGFDVLASVPDLAATPVLVLTGSNAKEDINRAFRSGAEYLCKPAEDSEVARFARRALTGWWTGDARLAALVDDLCERAGLRPSDCEMIGMCVGGLARDELAAALDLAPDTLKSRIRRILRRTGHATFDELVLRLLEDAKAGSELSARARAQRWT